MKVSKKAQYGLRALIFLAKQKNKIVSLSEIAKEENLPADFLEKILSQLVKKKIIKTKKGKNGGYFLSKSPQKIKVIKIIESLEGKLKLVKCLHDFCPLSRTCSAKKCWKKLQKIINSALSSITLANLI